MTCGPSHPLGVNNVFTVWIKTCSTFTFPFPLNALSDVLILTSGPTLGGAEVTAALGRINIQILILTHTYTQCSWLDISIAKSRLNSEHVSKVRGETFQNSLLCQKKYVKMWFFIGSALIGGQIFPLAEWVQDQEEYLRSHEKLSFPSNCHEIEKESPNCLVCGQVSLHKLVITYIASSWQVEYRSKGDVSGLGGWHLLR